MLSPTVISNPGLYHAWQIAGAEQNETPARAFMSTAAGVGSGAGNVPPSLNNDAQPFPSFIFFTDP
jgi:hypothetical protein